MTQLLQIRIAPNALAQVKSDIDLYGKHARFALARALNGTGLAIQSGTQAEIQPHLTVRTAASLVFLQRRVMIPRGGYATRDNPTVVIGVMDGDVLSNRGKSSLLAAIASGGDTKTQGRWGPLAVPTSVLRSYPAEVIPAAFYPRALRVLEANYTGAGRNTVASRTRGRSKRRAKYGVFGSAVGHIIVKGKSRTFAIDPRFHPGLKPSEYGVYQRTGPGKHDVQLLWAYKLSVPIPGRIDFQGIADRITSNVWATMYSIELDRALSTAL